MAQSPKASADSLYSKENYSEAADIYQKMLQEGKSSDLYYNLGNCYYKMDNLPLAILNYERAWRLSPGDNDIRANLALVRGKTEDKVTPPSELFFVTWWRDFTCLMSVDQWVGVGFVSFLLLLAGIAVYLFMAKIQYRKAGFYCAGVMLAVCIVANLCALSLHYYFANHLEAIIIDSAVTAKSSPSESSTDLFVVHAGSKVQILDDSMTDWIEVKLEEGKVGWMPKGVLEEI